MNLSEEKAAARKAALDRRRTADPSVTDAANNHLVQAVRSASGRIVSGYWPIRAELDPRPAMTALTPTHDLCLPVVATVALSALDTRGFDGGIVVRNFCPYRPG